jgi:hypothetical protein
MRGGGFVRILLSAAVLLLTASCVAENNWSPIAFWLGPSHLALSNFRFDHAPIEAVISAAPDCSPINPNVPPIAFDLPFKDICWRRQAPGGMWTDWNRAHTASGHSIDVQL